MPSRVPAPRSLPLVVILITIVTLASLAVPPVIEDHLAPGFCSADCPVQHAGHGAATPPPPAPAAASRLPIVAAAAIPDAGVEASAVASFDAPRGPPPA